MIEEGDIVKYLGSLYIVTEIEDVGVEIKGHGRVGNVRPGDLEVYGSYFTWKYADVQPPPKGRIVFEYSGGFDVGYIWGGDVIETFDDEIPYNEIDRWAFETFALRRS